MVGSSHEDEWLVNRTHDLTRMSIFPAGGGLSDKMQLVLETLPTAVEQGRNIVGFPPLFSYSAPHCLNLARRHLKGRESGK